MLKILRPIVAFLALTLSFYGYSEEQPGIDEIKQMAEQGDAKAQAKYGSIYFLGDKFELKPNLRYKIRKKYEDISYLLEGISKSDEKATDWMLKSAEQGYVDAEVFMAAMYDRGMGVKQNESEATKWYKKAGEQGNEMAKAVLGPYARSRMTASKDVPFEYAVKILNTK